MKLFGLAGAPGRHTRQKLGDIIYTRPKLIYSTRRAEEGITPEWDRVDRGLHSGQVPDRCRGDPRSRGPQEWAWEPGLPGDPNPISRRVYPPCRSSKFTAPREGTLVHGTINSSALRRRWLYPTGDPPERRADLKRLKETRPSDWWRCRVNGRQKS